MGGVQALIAVKATNIGEELAGVVSQGCVREARDDGWGDNLPRITRITGETQGVL
jgi:hypothetical protein